MTTEEAIAAVEAAGLYWAIEGGPGRGQFISAVNRKGNYVGDDLCAPGACSGDTIAEALLNAMAWYLEYEKTTSGHGPVNKGT